MQIVDEMAISVRDAHEEWLALLQYQASKEAGTVDVTSEDHVCRGALSLTRSLARSWCQPISCLTLVSRSR